MGSAFVVYGFAEGKGVCGAFTLQGLCNKWPSALFGLSCPGFHQQSGKSTLLNCSQACGGGLRIFCDCSKRSGLFIEADRNGTSICLKFWGLWEMRLGPRTMNHFGRGNATSPSLFHLWQNKRISDTLPSARDLTVWCMMVRF